MIEQKDYLIKRTNILKLNMFSYPSLDQEQYFHKKIFDDIQLIAKKKINKGIKSKRLKGFLDTIISIDFYVFTWNYYFVLKNYYKDAIKNNDTRYLKEDYLCYLLYLFMIMTDDNELDYYMNRSVSSLNRFIELFKTDLVIKTGGDYKYYLKQCFKYYLTHRKEFIS